MVYDPRIALPPIERLAGNRGKKWKTVPHKIFSEQFALVAAHSGMFPVVDRRDFTSIHLKKGEVWRYGVCRYNEPGDCFTFLTALPLHYLVQFHGDIQACIREEKRKNYVYPLLPENRMRAEPLVEPPGHRVPMPGLKSKFYCAFVVSCVTWHELGHKTPFHRVSNCLNEFIDIRQYGPGLQGLAIVFIIMPPEIDIHQEQIDFQKGNQQIIAYRKIPYLQISTGNFSSNTCLLAESYLETLELIFSDAEIPYFDWLSLYIDVTTLFRSKGWLRPGKI